MSTAHKRYSALHHALPNFGNHLVTYDAAALGFLVALVTLLAASGVIQSYPLTAGAWLCRYLAELVKFRLAAPNSLLLRLKALLDDFSGPHVEAATTLVENAGRFLLRVPGVQGRGSLSSHAM